MGFDCFFGTIHGAGSFYDPVSLTLENEPIPAEDDDFYYTTEIGEYAARFIEEEGGGDDPFFLYMPFTSPHWPTTADARRNCATSVNDERRMSLTRQECQRNLESSPDCAM